jgi:hypothetical protein
MFSRSVPKLTLSSALCSTALFPTACSHGGSGATFSIAGNAPEIAQPPAADTNRSSRPAPTATVSADASANATTGGLVGAVAGGLGLGLSR